MLARTCIAFRVASRIHYVVALRSSRSSASQRQLQSPCYDAMANIYRSMPLPKIAVCIFLRRPSCVQLRGCQVSSPADKSTRSSTCSPVQDRGLRGCWSHPHLRSARAVQALGSPESTRAPQQPAKVNNYSSNTKKSKRTIHICKLSYDGQDDSFSVLAQWSKR